MSNKRLNRPLLSESFVDKFGDIFDSFPASESCSQPSPSSDELERVSLDEFVTLSNSDHTTLPSSPVSRLEGLPHNYSVPCGIKGIVDSPLLILQEEGLC